MSVQGSCLCGGVKYVVEGAIGRVVHCHCSMCRKATGAAFRTRAAVPTEAFRWLTGEELVSRYHSSPGETRTFCSVCGATLPTLFRDHPEQIGLPLGTLDDDPGVRPSAHVWVSSKAPWWEINDALPQYPEGLALRQALQVTEPSAVAFDLGETLFQYIGVPLSWSDEYPNALSLVAAACRCELTPARLQSGRAVLLRYNTRVNARPEQGEYTAEHIFQELLLGWGLSQDLLASAVAAFFGHFSSTVQAFPESAGVIAHLRELGVPVAVLTDVPYGMPTELVKADVSQAGLPIPEELLVTSAMVGHRKPHPAGFSSLAQRLGVACSDLLYVGNERKDIEGGNAAGCRTALIWRSLDPPPAWGQQMTLRSLDELRQLRYRRR